MKKKVQTPPERQMRNQTPSINLKMLMHDASNGKQLQIFFKLNNERI